MLLGGEPGAGKSAALSVVIAAAALDPTARLWLLDGKGVEETRLEPEGETWPAAQKDAAERVGPVIFVAATRGDGDQANMWLSLQGMVRALRSELQMFVALKADKPGVAWITSSRHRTLPLEP